MIIVSSLVYFMIDMFSEYKFNDKTEVFMFLGSEGAEDK